MKLTYSYTRSTRNTRIERLWVEVGSQFARRWRAFFTRLGELHHLDRKVPTHLWLLHHLFLDEINADCAQFVEEWNAHPVSGSDMHNMSPLVCILSFEHSWPNGNKSHTASLGYAAVEPNI